MRLHPRVEIVNRAEPDMAEAFHALYGAGSVVEEACEAVALVEIACLRRSAGEPDFPMGVAARPNTLWHRVEEIVEEHGLTWGEAARCVHYLSGSYLNFIVRVERHGNRPDARADLEYEPDHVERKRLAQGTGSER